jgi:rhamnose utilization protein RhaD (predicted bifunctional aldolase and dehydrogenase)
MSVHHSPDGVPAELVNLTRKLGDPAADLVVLAEGNTSARLPDGTFAVKASGARMDTAAAGDFVIADPEPLLSALADPRSSQEALTGLLDVGPDAEGRPRRASIETLVHVVALEYGGATWVAHTHPTAVVGLLAVDRAEELWASPLFPDEAVVVGPPAWVPYAEPGLALGRAVVASISEYTDREGHPPRLVLLGNHGIVALGATSAEVEAITTMCVKAARVRSVALGAGRLAPLDSVRSRALAGRTDETERRARLGGIPS